MKHLKITVLVLVLFGLGAMGKYEKKINETCAIQKDMPTKSCFCIKNLIGKNAINKELAFHLLDAEVSKTYKLSKEKLLLTLIKEHNLPVESYQKHAQNFEKIKKMGRKCFQLN